jgi:hypothetical protein
MIAAAVFVTASTSLAALPLGQVADGGAIDCPMGAAQGASCRAITVQCPGVPDIDATVAISEPTGDAKATVVLHRGADGMEFFDFGFVAAYLDAGLRTVQIAWATPWEGEGDGGVKACACRPATAFRWAFDELHGGDVESGFCAQGHSGGSGAIGYALAHYGLEDTLDFAMFDAGPVFGRIDYGCEPSLYAPGSIEVCPEMPMANYTYGGNSTNVDRWMGTQSCGSPFGDASQEEIDAWASNSIVSDGADYEYPQTVLSFWECATNPNGTPGLGAFYMQQLASEWSVTCQVDDCMGEPPWPGGFDGMVGELVAGCVPRHMASGTDDGGSSSGAGEESSAGASESESGTESGSASASGSASGGETGSGSTGAETSTESSSSSGAAPGEDTASGCACGQSRGGAAWLFAIGGLLWRRRRQNSH